MSTSYTFGRFHLDTAERRLMRDGQAVPLTPKAFDTLLVLVQHAGHAVSKDDLLRAVWPDGFVEETNLAFNISTLRKTLSEGHAGDRYIETVPKLGYRFVMPVKVDSVLRLEITPLKRSNLPAQLTRFIGRAQEIAEVTVLVQTRRLVTLTGSGGAGKTRLALEAGGQLLALFADGVWLAEFAPLTDESLVPATVVAVFRLQAQTRSPEDTLVDFIGEKRMLLIMDNCEHVIDASAKLVEALLRSCPNLRILATSREALRVAGEAIWRVPSMEVPDAGRTLTIEQVADFDAVQLFVEHAALVRPGFALKKENLEVVLTICRQLDGIPLAIEMAAAQLDALNVNAVFASLEHCFDLLTHGSRTAVPRHQTLRATLDWSFNLLSDPERALLARLSVFRGGFTADAALLVCEASQHTLLHLVRKSMIDSYVDNTNNKTRYRLLEVVRQFADEKLLASGEYQATLNRHLDWFLAMAEKPIDLEGPRVDPWLQQVRPEYDNIRLAHATALKRDDHGERAMRLVYAMTRYWYAIALITDHENWLAQVMCRKDIDRASAGPRARLIAAQFGLHLVQGRMLEAYPLGEAALVLFREAEDMLGTAWCLEHLANNLFSEQAQAYAEEALELFRKLGSCDGEGRALRALGTSAFRAGKPDLALALLEESIRVAPWDSFECMWHVYEINPQRALWLYTQEPWRLTIHGFNASRFWEELAYATLLLASEEFEHSRFKLLSVLQDIEFIVGYDNGDGCVQMLAMGYIEHRMKQDDAAVEWLDKAIALARRIPFDLLIYTAQFLKTVFQAPLFPIEVTKRKILECLKQVHQHTYQPMVVCAFVQLADLARRDGKYEEVCRWLGVAESFSDVCQRLGFWMNGVPWLWHRDAQTNIVSPALAAAREALGDESFEAAYVAGQHMTLDEAVELAMSENQ